MKSKNKLLSVLIPLVVAIVAVVALAISGRVTSNSNATQPTVKKTAETTTVEETTEDNTVYSVSILAVGDNLIHDTLYQSGEKSDGTRDYSDFYKNVKNYVQAADIAIINQETILGGDVREFSGYPMFNSPQEVGDAAVEAGFDVFTCATNHAMDVYSKGIESELNWFNTKHPEVVHTGLNASEEDYNKITYYEKNNIKFAFLNYTYGTNGIPLPDDKPWIVNLLDKDKITKDMTEARANADVVIVFPHWGIEYNMDVSDEQREYTKLFSDLGADIVIGCHPHVIEPVEWYTNETTGKKMLVYYSLGNYISHQHDLETLLGGMAEITVEKQGDTVTITNAKMAGIVDFYERRSEGGYTFSPYKLTDYTDEIASRHRYDYATPENLNELFNSTIAEEFRDN